jgi:hypothetical protein
VLHFVKPAGSGGRLNDERRLARADEADRWDLVKGSVAEIASSAGAVMAMRIMRGS